MLSTWTNWAPGRCVVLVPKSHRYVLTEKQQVGYRNYPKAFLTRPAERREQEEAIRAYPPYAACATGCRTAASDSGFGEERAPLGMGLVSATGLECLSTSLFRSVIGRGEFEILAFS